MLLVEFPDDRRFWCQRQGRVIDMPTRRAYHLEVFGHETGTVVDEVKRG